MPNNEMFNGIIYSVNFSHFRNFLKNRDFSKKSHLKFCGFDKNEALTHFGLEHLQCI